MKFRIEITIRTTGFLQVEAADEDEARNIVGNDFSADVEIDSIKAIPGSHDPEEDSLAKLYTPVPKSIEAHYESRERPLP